MSLDILNFFCFEPKTMFTQEKMEWFRLEPFHVVGVRTKIQYIALAYKKVDQ